MAGIKSALVMIITVVYLWRALSPFVMEKARFVSGLTGKHDYARCGTVSMFEINVTFHESLLFYMLFIYSAPSGII